MLKWLLREDRERDEQIRREGVIEGLERARWYVDNPKLSYDDILTAIRIEIERLRAEQKEG